MDRIKGRSHPEKQLTPGRAQSIFLDPVRGLDFLHPRG
jgi:hypothetical protein